MERGEILSLFINTIMRFKEFCKKGKDAKKKGGDVTDAFDPRYNKASDIPINPDDLPESGPTKKVK